MGRTIQPARWPPGTAPETQGMVYTTGGTFYTGAPLIYDGTTGRVIEAATPTAAQLIVGFAAQPIDSAPGFQVANANVVVAYTGRENVVSVWKANRTTIFSSRLVNNSAVPIAVAQANVSKKYGLSQWPFVRAGLTINEWAVDTSLTATPAVEVVAIDTTLNIVLFRVLDASIAQP